VRAVTTILVPCAPVSTQKVIHFYIIGRLTTSLELEGTILRVLCVSTNLEFFVDIFGLKLDFTLLEAFALIVDNGILENSSLV
jgi:hypothetical protein